MKEKFGSWVDIGTQPKFTAPERRCYSYLHLQEARDRKKTFSMPAVKDTDLSWVAIILLVFLILSQIGMQEVNHG